MPRAKKPEEELCRKVGVSLPPDDYDKIIAYCNREERQISWVIRKALALWFEKEGL